MNTEPNRSTTCALLLDEGNLVPRWQYEALNAAIAAGLVVSIVVHGRAPNRRRQLRKHAVYYALAAVSRATMRQLSHVDVSPLIPPAAPVISFDIELEGIWQRIPDSVTRQFVGLECVLKFGMGLLRDPDSIPVAGGVVSTVNVSAALLALSLPAASVRL